MLAIEWATATVICVAMTCATVILVMLVGAATRAQMLRNITLGLLRKKQADGKSEGDKLAEEIQRGMKQ